MNFPEYVPAGAREHIRRTLEGFGNHWKGVNAFVADYRKNGVSGDALMQLEREQSCLLRFANDARMRDVYAELEMVFTSSEQYSSFLRSAWGADIDFAPFRERVKKAKEVAPKVAKAARKLAALLDEAGKVGGGFAPDEFFSVRALLETTDNHEMNDHNLHMWRSVRSAITGRERDFPATGPCKSVVEEFPEKVILVPDEDANEAKLNHPDAQIIVMCSVSTADIEKDPEQEARNMLIYAWEKAPDLPAILGTVAYSADKWNPQESGAIGAAIASRQHSISAEYLRAFAKLLDENGIPTTSIHKAIAGTATVVLDDADPDSEVSPDAVRMALARTPNNSD
jgi:hypothetical protein